MIDNQHTKDCIDGEEEVTNSSDEAVIGVDNDSKLKEEDTSTKYKEIENYDVWFYAMKLMALRSLSALLQ